MHVAQSAPGESCQIGSSETVRSMFQRMLRIPSRPVTGLFPLAPLLRGPASRTVYLVRCSSSRCCCCSACRQHTPQQQWRCQYSCQAASLYQQSPFACPRSTCISRFSLTLSHRNCAETQVEDSQERCDEYRGTKRMQERRTHSQSTPAQSLLMLAERWIVPLHQSMILRATALMATSVCE